MISRTQLMSPLIEKILNGEIMPDDWTPTLLAQLGRNAGAKKMGIHARQRQWTDDEKEKCARVVRRVR
jgi:hypothetical protein